MRINVKTDESYLKLCSGDIVALRRSGMTTIQYYIATGEDYLINMRCGSHRYRRDNLTSKKALLRAIDDDSNVTLIKIYSREQWEMNLIEKGTK
ncbi:MULTISPECIES: hypothetical protein [Bacillus cereus group]|uniref:hypothetical protein n=1 Tax=Bacillus cereus group TaxID=86661 RepID=UPI000BECF3EF|nr:MULTISPECIES: hypothetical protein [Bacillus cereus group]PEF88584.1 hypothetical protein CON51_05105 [Bacillus thuringiensis]PES54761.1 hypothetical protein CN506_19905 [Bacillus thuringiensis]PFP03548.1 hypothetical protein COJ91_22420 [Bacillus thuringiensis]PFS55717.1 hypothetical protein COK64_23515 [Bacillus thuringiensis]PGL62369.1 hypothetical protein CN939_19680 [Bacillus thuringiensis]